MRVKLPISGLPRATGSLGRVCGVTLGTVAEWQDPGKKMVEPSPRAVRPGQQGGKGGEMIHRKHTKTPTKDQSWWIPLRLGVQLQ